MKDYHASIPSIDLFIPVAMEAGNDGVRCLKKRLFLNR